MEKENKTKNSNINRKKNINKDVKKEDIIRNYIEFYNKNIKKIHILISFLAIILFIIFVVAKIHEFSSGENVYEKSTYFEQLKYNFMLSFLIIFAGITPFFFLSVIGVADIFANATKIAGSFALTHNVAVLVLGIILGIISVIVICLLIAVGIYYCTLSSKKFIYSQKKGFTLKEFKLSFYKLRKSEEKIKEMEEKIKKENLKAEKLNVKVPYLNFLITYIIANIILLITAIVIR